MPTRSHPGTRPSGEEGISRVRGLLHDTFAHLGYARVPDAPERPDDAWGLVLQEFQRELVEHREQLIRMRTRSGMARAFSTLLAAAADKVERDEAWADAYAKDRADDGDDLVEAAARSIPDEWRDL
jgi:hypothetical protein